MFDPVGAFTRIRDFYISYLETAFSIQNRHVSLERRALLESGGSLCTEPIIEPLTRYKAADFVLTDLMNDQVHDERVPGLDVRQRQAFVHLALSGLFDSEPLRQFARSTAREISAVYPPSRDAPERNRRRRTLGRHVGHGLRENGIFSVARLCHARKGGYALAAARARISRPGGGGKIHRGARSTSTPTFPIGPWRRIGTVHRSLRRETVSTRNATPPYER